MTPSASLHRAAAVVGAAAALLLDVQSTGAVEPSRGLRGGHPMHVVPPGRPAALAPVRAHVTYFGGRVVSSVQVVNVLWGDGPFAPFVAGDGPRSMARFLADLVGSPYLDGLAQYGTDRVAANGQPGTGQRIVRGALAETIRIAPDPANDAPIVDDANVVAELADQLSAGVLPAPALDAAGYVATVYLIHFPAGRTITLGRGASCATFCAYHGAFEWDGRNVYYAVLPDLSPGSGCDAGCGAGGGLAAATSIASHELAELITDPEGGLATTLGPPVAWYDPVSGEIGDICLGQDGTVAGASGASWVVQRWWSNVDGACVAASGVNAVARAAAPAGDRPAPGAAGVMTAALRASLPPAEAAPARGSELQVLAAEPTPLPTGSGSRFTIQEENDGLGIGPHRTDSSYTQGLRISSLWASRTPLAPEGRERLGFAVGQNIYTPTNIRETELDALRQDRPYAGWLYAALLWEVELDRAPLSLHLGADADGPGASTFGVEVAVGTIGPRSGAAEIQTGFHRLLRDLSGSGSPPDPAGWSLYQVGNRVTADLSLRYQLDLVRASASLGAASAWTGSRLAVRVSPRARLDLGSTYDAAWLGLELRGGLMEAPRRSVRPRFPVELYVFGGASGRYVAYDALIEAPLLHGVTTLVSPAPWIAELDVGAVVRLGGVELGYAQLWRTNDLRRVPPGARRVHDVGQVRISFVY
ncbi:lipid A deacylase LpxR family protein [Anaeromyxobacter oryzisoli]|uniref:lipid A deacylase LpxR family protein n=1 Tax=Anaeromyxobacter oryzisoli TaxID=2925408 RepID=UPI001F57A8E6|nr:lipid A deacylase LpxR family protein [Anaeromyxobacter sp. SG63]